MNLSHASNRLAKIPLHPDLNGLLMEIIWFRVLEAGKDWVVGRHTHSSYEFHFVYEGSCLVQLENEEFTAKAGEFYLAGPGVVHAQKSLEDRIYTEFCLNCQLISTDPANPENQRLLRVLSAADCRPVQDSFGAGGYFYKALEEASSRRLGYLACLNQLASLTVLSAIRALDTPGTAYASRLRPQNDYRFEQIHRFIEDNIHLISVNGSLCEQFNLSEKQISRIIQSHTGKCTKQYINSVKLQKAQGLLSNPSCSVREISQQLGFSSEYYFNQFFKRMEGVPPGAYRKRKLQA